jgi:hypothetical protein
MTPSPIAPGSPDSLQGWGDRDAALQRHLLHLSTLRPLYPGPSHVGP